MFLEHRQEQLLNHFPGQPIPAPKHYFVEESLPNIQLDCSSLSYTYTNIPQLRERIQQK